MTATTIGRRGLLATGTTLAASGIIRPPEARAAQQLNLVLESEVVILDPYMTTAAITRTFGFHVFDTLFAMDGQGRIQPQMVESHTVSADRLTWNFSLRPGLKFHDGTPVTATDVVASLNRWMPRDALGRMLREAHASLTTKGTLGFELVLKRPFPLVLDVLGKPNAPVPFILPERLAKTPGDQRITEIIGSGPFRFLPDQWRPGNVMVLEKFADYVPRSEPPDFLAGGKRVKVDSIALRVMPDQATGATALLANEIDYQQYVPFDWIPRLERSRDIKLLSLGGLHQFQGNFRLNHAAPPFDDPAVRRVLWKLVDQSTVLQAIGIPEKFRAPQCPSFWMCDAPYSTTAGAEIANFSIEEAKADLARTAYAGQPVQFLEVSGSISQTAAHVLIQNMKAAGFTVDEQQMDWGTVLARRARHDGWSMFAVYSNGVDMLTPLTHFYVASTCADYPGWSCDERIPALTRDFANAETLEERLRLTAEIQRLAYELTPSVMWGQFTIPAAYRTSLVGLMESSFPIFWNVEKA
ncbi:peptide/nickel transport system substrate-binding protein [Humitalea rosea]|uniref:Peptide/nickel transport system substrate-binding protein n=1 Tax=Humitalea rosea TaxID=990373 RepID=A0A2W7JEE5_9PROT|nr:ABC transporter substrate-binding protein [Humitalea rosea]PZW50837.1 peptide/nickel transport system substrate-binding protein [Humitalea rosea]